MFPKKIKRGEKQGSKNLFLRGTFKTQRDSPIVLVINVMRL